MVYPNVYNIMPSGWLMIRIIFSMKSYFLISQMGGRDYMPGTQKQNIPRSALYHVEDKTST